ncbi:putative reverse transcriptase domain-containing protein [Tanacetum coccineum]
MHGTEDGNVGQGVISITTTFPYAFIVLITIQESHTTDNSALIRPGPTLYAKLVSCESSRKSVNFCTLIAPVGNVVDAAIHLESIRAISEEFANTTYSFFFGKWIAYLVVANYVRNTWSKYGRVKSMLNSSNGLFFFQFNFENGLEAMLENGPWSSYARAMIELRPDEELKDTIMVRHVSNKNDANNNGKKQQAEVSRIEVSNSNLFDALNSIDNDDDLGMNGGNSSSAGKGATSSSISTAPIAERIDKFETQMIEGKLLFVDDDVKPLKKVVCTVNADNDSEVEEVFAEHSSFIASTSLKRGIDGGHGTNSLLEQ